MNSIIGNFSRSEYCLKLVKYLIPLAIVSIIMGQYYLKLQKKIASKKIAIRYGFKELLEIAKDIEGSDDLIISIDNKWKKDISCEITVSCPEDIKVSFKDDKESNSIKKNDIIVRSGETYWEYVLFRYEGNPGETEAKIQVICKDENGNNILEKEDKIKLLKLK